MGEKVIQAMGHPIFYIAFWVIILGYSAWRLWRIERLLVSINTSLIVMMTNGQREIFTKYAERHKL